MKNVRKIKNGFEKYFEGASFVPILLEEDIEMENNIIYVNSLGFHIFDKYWKLVDNNHIKKLCKNKLGVKANPTYINKTVELLMIENNVDITEINKNKNRIIFLNGTLDISDWENPTFYKGKYFIKDYCTIQLDYNYNKKAQCQEFVKFLNSTFEDNIQIINIVQEMLGYCLTTSTKFEKGFILFGEGSNGKSVLLNTIEKLVSYKNIASVSMSDLDKQFSRATLQNKLINLSSEQENKVQDTGYLKKIISGDIIDSAFKFKPIFEFNPFCKMLFAMNHLPNVTDNSHGYYRRFIIIPFNRIFTESEQDRQLKQKIECEIEGVLQFALLGLKRLSKQNQFTKSIKCESLLNEYKHDNNPAEQFFDSCIKKFDNDYSITSDIYKYYTDWCKENGYKPLNNAMFGKEIIKKYGDVKKRISIEGKKHNVYVNLGYSKT